MRASEMRKGQTVKIDGKLYAIVDYQHVKLGKGGAVYQTRLKSLTDGSIQNVRLRSEETVEEAYLDRRTYEYLYSAGSEHVLMEIKTFDQVTLGDDAFGDGPKFLKPNSRLQVSMYEGRPIIIELPNTVDLKVTDTQPEIRGATATSQSKPATLETGLVVSVPPFIRVGDIIRVDTRSSEYVTRVKE
ncbi:MAG: elongation factor P [Planctomycetota bacterium]